MSLGLVWSVPRVIRLEVGERLLEEGMYRTKEGVEKRDSRGSTAVQVVWLIRGAST